ncbi:unnamed protein product [Nezara viridula]|uniref:Uncharacterized protein n=1 Tax=Nezara viridula TaxID=85310 RepID=A0A9P0H1N1_NEZVI|nr:unnamed protein product [Nezara viridula]
MVLRPQSNLAVLDVWDYYINEDLKHGPTYDLELLQLETTQQEETETIDGMHSTSRQVVITGYDNVRHCIPDAFTHLLEEIHNLETELGHLPQKWKILWDKLELPTTDSLTATGKHLKRSIRFAISVCSYGPVKSISLKFGGIETVTSSVSQNCFNSSCREGLVYVKRVRTEGIGLWHSERVFPNNTDPNERSEADQLFLAYEIEGLQVLLKQIYSPTSWEMANEGKLPLMLGNTLAENSYILLFLVESNFTLILAEDEDMEILPTPDTTRGLTQERRRNFFIRLMVIKLICEPESITILDEYHRPELKQILPKAVPRRTCELVIAWHEIARELFVT